MIYITLTSSFIKLYGPLTKIWKHFATRQIWLVLILNNSLFLSNTNPCSAVLDPRDVWVWSTTKNIFINAYWLDLTCLHFVWLPLTVLVNKVKIWYYNFKELYSNFFNSLPYRDTFWHFCKKSRPRSGSSCKSCLIRAYSVCLLKYD